MYLLTCLLGVSWCHYVGGVINVIILHYNSSIRGCRIGSEHLYAMCTESTSSVRLKIVSKHLKLCIYFKKHDIFY